jgi:hypothetical protein
MIVSQSSQSNFEHKYSSLKKKLLNWKSEAASATLDDYDEALQELECMKLEYTNRKETIVSLQQEIMVLRESLETEKMERKKDVANLEHKISCIEKKYEQMTQEVSQQRKMMLIRSMATASQFQMTQQFPAGTFTTKYPYSCTFDNIKSKVTGKSTQHDEALSNIVGLFTDQNIPELDISECIKIVRELGTSYSHPTTMADDEGNVFCPGATQLRQFIDEVSFPNDQAKEAAVAVCAVLGALHEGKTTPILSTALPTT